MAVSAIEAVASGLKVVALAATEADSIVPVLTKYPLSLFSWDILDPDTIIFFHSAIVIFYFRVILTMFYLLINI